MGLTLMMGIVLALCVSAAAGDGDEQPPVGTIYCSEQVYTAADSFAADIDLVLEQLPLMDSDILPTIDLNVYSPRHQNPVAFGQRICTDGDKVAIVCEKCFGEAQSQLVSVCRDNYSAGGEITLDKCFMRYEIFNFLPPA